MGRTVYRPDKIGRRCARSASAATSTSTPARTPFAAISASRSARTTTEPRRATPDRRGDRVSTDAVAAHVLAWCGRRLRLLLRRTEDEDDYRREPAHRAIRLE